MTKKFENLLKRALAKNLKAELKTHEVGEGVEGKYLDIPIQAGQNYVHLHVEAVELDDLEKIPFEALKFVEGYYAVYSPAEGWVEVLVENAGRMSPMVGFRRLHRLIGTTKPMSPMATPDQLGPIEVTDSERGRSLRLGAVSEATRTLLDLSELNDGSLRLQRGLSLRMEGLNLERHGGALRAIERLANAFLFQIELLTDVGFYVHPRRSLRQFRLMTVPEEKTTLSWPQVEYDPEPLSLYWYSRVAENMPLLQFLAFYQCLEFFFPVYSVREAQRVLRTKIKDPTFNFDKETDIAKLLQALRVSYRGGYGSEREQLTSVVENCVQGEELVAFVSENDDRKEFYRDKDKFSKVSRVRLQLSGSASELLRSVAERLYDIRCRIVHSKADQDQAVAVILPFSKEAQMLGHDIVVARFVARKTLVASGSVLQV